MNKTRYKVIFNHTRGQMMAVAENTTRAGKSTQDSGAVALDGAGEMKADCGRSFALPLLSFSLMLALGLTMMAPTVGAAGIIADKAAPKDQQPTILRTASGLPQVNIRTPSAGGVSMNQYRQFDVDAQGAILNNSRHSARTQIGGWVQGNPWLAGGEARIIVNQVNSNNPSLLNGHIEVAGRRAEVIITNPSGIQVNGGGFINAAGVTLSTGKPLISNGHLEGFRVRAGTIAVSGQGLDSSNADYTRILAHAAQINAGIWGKELGVVSGRNTIDAAGKPSATEVGSDAGSTAAPAPAVAIDVGRLGGMYAGKITLIGTDKGLGINNAGQIFAGAGGISLSADGRLNNSGSMVAADKAQSGAQIAGISIRSKEVINSGSISAQGKAALDARSIDNRGLLAGANELNIRNRGTLSNSGKLSAARLDIDTAGLNNSGRISQSGMQALNMDAGTVHNRSGGLMGYTPLENNSGGGQPHPGGDTPAPSTATGGGSTTPAPRPATPVVLAAGWLKVSGSLDNRGTLTANGATHLNAHQGLNNQGRLHLGTLNVDGALLDNRHATLIASNASIRTQNLNNQDGNFTVTGSLRTDNSQIHNQNGQLRSGAADIRSQKLNNRQGLLSAEKALTVNTPALDNRQGRILSGAQAIIHSTGLDNREGSIDAASVVIQSEGLDNRKGAIRANQTLDIEATDRLDNRNGQISSAGQLSIHDRQRNTLSIDNTDGSILVGRSAHLQSKALNNNGTLAAGADLGIVLKDSFNVARDISAGGTLNLSTAGTLYNAHTLQGSLRTEIQAHRIDNSASGKIQSGGHTEVNATDSLNNRGLINSNGVTLIKAGKTVDNVGSGRIYGNHIAIGTERLSNREETADGTTHAAVIAARARLDLGAKEIENREQALLYSGGALLLGGSLNAQNQATGTAERLDNRSARIESAGDMKLATQVLRNTNAHFSTEEYLAAKSDQVREYAARGSTTRYRQDRDGWWDRRSSKRNQQTATFYTNGNDGTLARSIDAEHWQVWDYHTQTYKEKIKTSVPGEIIVGGNLYASGKDWLNQDSHILIGGALLDNGLTNKLENRATQGQGREQTVGSQWVSTWKKGWYKKHKYPRRFEKNHAPYDSSQAFTHDFATPVMVYREHEAIPAGSKPAINPVGKTQTTTVAGADGNSRINTVKIDTRLPNSSLFNINPNSKGWLIETDPAFADYRKWLGSDYMLKALKLDPANMHKRLGDGYYEQRLINEQIARLTGYRRLDGYENDEAQFRALMNAGVTFAKAQRLTPGIALSPEQITRLTSDIVWLENQTITLPDGSTHTVLAPRVYVVARKGDLNASGSLISAEQIQLKLQNGSIDNSGTIVGRKIVDLGAQNINNLAGGRISGQQVALTANNSIDNIGGVMDAEQKLQLQAQDIRIATTTQSSGDHNNGQTSIDRVAGLYISGDQDGVINVMAGNQLDINAADINNHSQNGKTTLVGSKAVNIGTVTAQKQESHISDARNYRIEHSQADVGSRIQGKGDVTVYSRGQLSIRQGHLNSDEGKITLAGNNVDISEGRQRGSVAAGVRNSSNLGLSNHNVAYKGGETHERSQGSSITGKTIQIQADRNILVRGSHVLADHKTVLSAGNNIDIIAARDSETRKHYQQERESGLSASLKDGVASIGYSKSRHRLQQNSTAQSLTLSQVGSNKGDTTIIAGKQLNTTAARLQAGGDLSLQGKEVKLDAGHISGSTHTEAQSRQSGFSVGLTYSPEVAAVSGYRQAKQDGGYSDSAVGKWMAHDNAVTKGSMAGLTPVVVRGGSSKTRNRKDSGHSEAVTTSASAGGKLNIIATDGSINSQGAQLSAESDALLYAKDSINLGFATNSQQQTASSKRSGVAIDNRNWMSPAGVHNDRGQGDGKLDQLTGSRLSVGGQSVLQTESGDINILGSTVVAQGDILINAAGNVNIRASQNSRQQSETQHNQGIGSAQISDTERFDGYMSNKSKSQSSQLEQQKSQLGSLAGKLQIQAGKNYTQQVADLSAGKDINIRAQRIDIFEEHNRASQHNSEKDLKIGQFSKISSPLIDLVNAADGAVNSKADSRTRALQGMAAAAQGYQAYSAIANGGALFKAETGTGFKTASRRQDNRYTQSQSNTLTAGGNIKLSSSSDDIRVQHSQIKAGDTITLNSAQNILLESGQNQQQAAGKNSNAGLSVGMGVSVGAQTGWYIYGEAGYGKGKNRLNANTHSNTTLQSEQLILTSRGDTTLKGAQASARRIDTNIGGKLSIESPQDKIDQLNKQSDGGIRVQVSLGTAWEVGGNYSSEKASGKQQTVGQQSGLFAGDGGYHIKADSVHLQGGAIASSAPKDKNELSSRQLSWENVDNHSSYSAGSVSLAGSYGSDSPSRNPDNQPFRETTLGRGFANTAGSSGASFTPGLPQQESGAENSTTYATLSPGKLNIGGKATTVEALGIHSDADSALAALPDLQAILNKQKIVAESTAAISSAVRTFSSERAKAAEREQAQARKEAEHSLQQRSDGSWEAYQSLPESGKQQLLSHHSGYAEASDSARNWGIGGAHSRALTAVTTAITGALGGQSNLQAATNALASYAAATIGNTVGHGENKNQAAQLLSHAILGATLAYVNGGNTSAGAISGAGSEAAAIYLTETLYNDGKTALDPLTGKFNPNLLPESDKAHITALTAAIGTVAGGIAGDSAFNAQLAGVVGKNAVENNYYLTPSAAKKAPEQARQIYRILKEQIRNECGANGRATECRQQIQRIVEFAKDSQFGRNYKDLQKESMTYLSENPGLVADYLQAQYQKLSKEDQSILHRYIVPGAEVVGGTAGIVISVKGGAASCAATFGFSCVAAAAGVVTSSDHVITGSKNFGKKASEQNPTITVQGLKQLGLSEQAASYVQFALDTASVGKAGMSVPVKSAKPGYVANAANSSGKGAGTTRQGIAGTEDQVPGRVQSRINVANGRTETTPLRATGEPVSAGFDHVLDGHFNLPIANNRSVFSISPDEVKNVLKDRTVVSSPVTAIDGGQFVRTVNTGKIIGTTSIKEGGRPTSFIKIFTDRAGNLITTYPVKGR